MAAGICPGKTPASGAAPLPGRPGGFLSNEPGVPMMLLTAIPFGTKLKHMARRHTTGCLLALWAFLVLPAFCTAGAIGHACDCGVSAECRHESDCSRDPCNNLTVSRPERNNGVAKIVPLVAACPSFAPGVQQIASLDVRKSFSERLTRKNLPYLVSDLPLLI